MGHTALVLGDQLSHGNPALDGRRPRAAGRGARQPRPAAPPPPAPAPRAERDAPLRGRAARARRGRGRRAARRRALRRRAAARSATSCARSPTPARPGAGSSAAACASSRPASSSPRRTTSPSGRSGRRRLVMEDFYREQRRRLGLLLAPGGKPAGGRWNFDKANRRPPQDGLEAPPPWLPEEDEIDAEVRRDLDAMGLHGVGRGRAARVAGDGRGGACRARRLRRAPGGAVRPVAGRDGPRRAVALPLAAVVLAQPVAARPARRLPGRRGRLSRGPRAAAVGRGLHPPGRSAGASTSGACTGCARARGAPTTRSAPSCRSRRCSGRGRPTRTACATCVTDVRERAYAHHIQRLMVLGNLMLLLGVRPWEAVEWFQAAFIDGAEWVMAPNVAGMATWADGGAMMTKPYAAGGNYIDRMSRYCAGCVHEPRTCPVTASYWDWTAAHRDALRRQPADADAAAHARPDDARDARRPSRARGGVPLRARAQGRPGGSATVRAAMAPELYVQRDQPAGVPPLAPHRGAHAARRAGGELLVPAPPRRLRVDRRARARPPGRRPRVRRGLRQRRARAHGRLRGRRRRQPRRVRARAAEVHAPGAAPSSAT